MPKNIIAGKIILGDADKGQGGALNEYLGFEKKKENQDLYRWKSAKRLKIY